MSLTLQSAMLRIFHEAIVARAAEEVRCSTFGRYTKERKNYHIERAAMLNGIAIELMAILSIKGNAP